MKRAIAWSVLAFLISQPALAREPAKRVAQPASGTLTTQAIPGDFDLAAIDGGSHWEAQRHSAPLDPEMPRGMDTREFAWDPPGFELQFYQDGPVFAGGALGSELKGMPKLAHVALDWDF